MKAEFKVGDTIRVKPTGRIVTIKSIKDEYYDFGYTEDGIHLIGDLRFPEQYELYRPSLKKKVCNWFNKLKEGGKDENSKLNK